MYSIGSLSRAIKPLRSVEVSLRLRVSEPSVTLRVVSELLEDL
jgi:hypothetical protein